MFTHAKGWPIRMPTYGSTTDGESSRHSISSADIIVTVTIHHDVGLATLLELDGSVLEQEDGFWIKVEVKAVEASEYIPHGIRYSLPDPS